MIVAIAGMHRSGTSMVTRLLNLCGLYLGNFEDIAFFSEDNPEGFWENIKFQKLNDEILFSFDGGWDLPPKFEFGWENSPNLAIVNQSASLVIDSFAQQPIWGWKDPRNSLTLPYWKKLIPNLKTIICVRHPYEVYRSLGRRGAASSAFSYNLWLTYNQQIIATTTSEERIFTHYDSYFYNPYAELRRLLDFLELDATDQEIKTTCQTILSNLRHNYSEDRDLYATNPSAELLNTYKKICLQAGHVYAESQSTRENTFRPTVAQTNVEEIEVTEILVLKNDLQSLRQNLNVTVQEKSRLQEENTILRYELGQIIASRSWQLVQLYQKVKLFILSFGSKRKEVLKNSPGFEYALKRILSLLEDGLGRLQKAAWKKSRKNKVICIYHRLGGYSSHHFNEAQGFIQEFRKRGKEFHLLISLHASAQITSKLHARAVLSDPTFCREWSFEERSQRFLEILHSQVDADLKVNDWVLLTISTQLEAHALTCWLAELSPEKKPWIIVLFLSDRWNRSGREEYERQVAEFQILKTTLASLTPADANRLIFCTVTNLLAEELSDLLGTRVIVVPLPYRYNDSGVRRSAKPNTYLPRVAILGGARREKGSHLIPEIVQACRAFVQVEFLVQVSNDSLTAEEAEKLAQVANEPQVTVIREPLPPLEHTTALLSADIALFPYEIIPYRKRTSEVFAEAVAYGIPVVATRGTWLADQIEAGRAAGVIFDNLEPDSIAQALARCVADLKSLQQSAHSVSSAWRKEVCLSAFVDFMEAQITLRQKLGASIPRFNPTAQSPDCAFVLSVEQGKLEAQAVLLVESLRKFGGVYANCPVYAISPRPSRQMGATCRATLERLGAHVITEDLLNPDETYGTAARLAACAWVERNLKSEILVSLDNDLFFVNEPDFSLKGVDFFARPVDVKGICPSETDDPLEVYWREVARRAGVDYEKIPWIQTTVDRVTVKASYNGGMVAVRRNLGLFQRAGDLFYLLRKADLAPHRDGEIEVFASTGFVGREASRWWGTSQLVLSLAATQLNASISIAPSTYNVPVHIAEQAEKFGHRITLQNAILVHYHWLLDQEHFKKDSPFYGSSALPMPVLQWMKRKTPLPATYRK